MITDLTKNGELNAPKIYSFPHICQYIVLDDAAYMVYGPDRVACLIMKVYNTKR